MKQFFKFFFASLLALIVAGVISFFIFTGIVGSMAASLSSGQNEKQVKDKSVLVIDLSQHFLEQKKESPFSVFKGDNNESIGLYRLMDKIKSAAQDDKIKGILLKASDNGSGLATSQQIRKALNNFKKSGKFIYAYGDYFSQSAYYIASVADSIFINPLGSVAIKGLVTQIPYFKGTFEKLGITSEIFYCGKFKSATEPFRRKNMSEANRIQTAALQNTVWNTYLKAFAQHTGTDTQTIDHWAQTATIQTAHDALKHHLVDGSWYGDQVEALLKKKCNLDDKDNLRLVSPKDYNGPTLPHQKGNKEIALLIAQGEIVDKANNNPMGDPQIAPKSLIKTIRKIKNNDDIKAVVFRVNSPGGSAMAAEKILRELDLLKKKKPVVVSMGDLAASGGYYISCHADSIFALPTTITGSIGVFGMMFNTQKFFNNKLGITFDEEKNAPYADLGNPNRPMSAQEKTMIQNSVDLVYRTFKTRVATGRNKSVAYIDSIAQGRVWTGAAGLKNGLVDGIGGLDRAFKSAAKLADLKNYKIVTYPKVKGGIAAFLSFLKGNDEVKEKIAAQALLKEKLGKNYRWFKLLTQLHKRNNHILMLMPVIPEVK